MKPGHFPIGSPESRAAARMLAANRRDTRRRIEIVTNVHMPWYCEGPDPDPWNDEEPHIGPWRDFGDVLFRFVYVPDGISFAEYAASWPPARARLPGRNGEHSRDDYAAAREAR